MKENILLLFCFLSLSVSLSAGQVEGSIRLVGGQDNADGRVEIFLKGIWGTVCNSYWDINDAHVVCRQLHFPGAIEALTTPQFGSGEGTVLLNNVLCDGSETSLLQCKSVDGSFSHCGPSRHAGVRCQKEQMNSNLSPEYDLDHSTSLSHQLGQLFDSRRDCDVNIPVLVHNNTSETICAHSLILSLNSQQDFRHLSIDTTSNCSEHAKTFIRYFYTRKIKFTRSTATCILRMAQDWGLTEVQNEVANLSRLFLTEDPTFQSQNSFYEYAVHIGDEALQEVCICYLAWNCEALIQSPAWTNLSFALVKALLSRSDLVVPNENVILNGVERWAAAKGNPTIPEALLKLIRFPLIQAEDLYKLNGSQYDAMKKKGYYFNTLSLKTLLPELKKDKEFYTPRIYTDNPWSTTFNHHKVNIYKDFGFFNRHGESLNSLTIKIRSPIHNSHLFTSNIMLWKTRVYISHAECSRDGVTCPTLPAVSVKIEENRNVPQRLQGKFQYSNKLIVLCEGTYVIHVLEFANGDGENFVSVPRSADQVYPCRSDQFSYQVVIRPYYVTD
ncbi:galectin-3-binding protein B-like [Gymnodraco acuticeps]|uniref:Galectin-3-binding protein B-like n=1 Tax=Gymnodraco acuticeps TaxID=8218 RepID=A0A6P8URR7_GYMAC|nr:galectin-3-binding protein B-like [Gymnodraco acuticeps]